MKQTLETNRIITGSLFGTASWAQNSLTASSADNFTVRGTLTAQTIVAQTIIEICCSKFTRS